MKTQKVFNSIWWRVFNVASAIFLIIAFLLSCFFLCQHIKLNSKCLNMEQYQKLQTLTIVPQKKLTSLQQQQIISAAGGLCDNSFLLASCQFIFGPVFIWYFIRFIILYIVTGEFVWEISKRANTSAH